MSETTVPTTATTDVAPETSAEPAVYKPLTNVIVQGVKNVEFQNTPFKMHPEVARLEIPRQTSAEYIALRDDVQKAKEIRQAIILSKDVDGTEYVVDGWHRIHIADELGLVRGKQYKVEFVKWNVAADVAMSSTLRRNLTEGQTNGIAMRLLALEKEKAAARQSANARITNLLKSEEAPEIIEVAYDRLKQNGDIASAYSVDTIITTNAKAASKLRGVFEHDGKLYASVDGSGTRFVAYQVVSLDEYRSEGGEITTYFNRMNEDEGKGAIGLDGVLVEYRVKNADEKEEKITAVLKGPSVIFAPLAVEDEEADAKKGKKKKTKAAEVVAAKTGVSTRTIEMLDRIQKEDPEAFARIENGEAQPGSTRIETVGSAYNRLTAESRRKDSEESGKLNPDEMTLEEFIENHPLYGVLQSNPLFIKDVKTFYFINRGIDSLRRGLKQAGSLSLTKKGDETTTFNRASNILAAVPHCYDWYEDASVKGGYNWKQVPSEPAPKPVKPVKPVTKANPKPEKAAKANATKATGKNTNEEVNGEEYVPEENTEGTEYVPETTEYIPEAETSEA